MFCGHRVRGVTVVKYDDLEDCLAALGKAELKAAAVYRRCGQGAHCSAAACMVMCTCLKHGEV